MWRKYSNISAQSIEFLSNPSTTPTSSHYHTEAINFLKKSEKMATNGTTTTTSLDLTKFYNVIDGKTSRTPNTRFTVNPSTLENNPDVPLSALEDVDRAVEAAQKAAKAWATVSWSERASAINKFADAMEAQIEDLVKLIMMEQGKPVSTSISAPLHIYGSCFQMPPGTNLLSRSCGLNMK